MQKSERASPPRVARAAVLLFRGGRVRVPTLLLNALDDPFCVSQNVDDHRGLVLANPSLVLATTRRGGHLAFYEGLMAKPWAERVALEWLGAALEVVPGAASVPLS